MIERQNIKAMIVKYYRNKKRTSLFNKKKGNYKSNTRNNMNPNQANEKYSLQY